MLCRQLLWATDDSLKNVPANVDQLDELCSTPTAAVIEAVRACDGAFAVLGAGGKMGFHLSLMLQKSLQALGRYQPVATVSRFSDVETRRRFEDSGFDVLSADLSNRVEVENLPRWDNVFFLAGVKFGVGNNPALLVRMNIQMPGFVSQYFTSSRICALSTGCVYSFTTAESGGSSEESPTEPPGDYARSCIGRETTFHRAAEECGTRSSLIRLNYSNDLRYGVLVDIAQQVRNGHPVDLSTGFVNVIWQGDAVAHTIQSMPHAAAPPFVVNVTGPSVVRVRDIANRFAELFGKTATFTGSEQPTAWLSNASQAHGLFGAPSVSLDTMIRWTAEWLENDGYVLNKPTQFHNRDGNY